MTALLRQIHQTRGRTIDGPWEGARAVLESPTRGSVLWAGGVLVVELAGGMLEFTLTDAYGQTGCLRGAMRSVGCVTLPDSDRDDIVHILPQAATQAARAVQEILLGV